MMQRLRAGFIAALLGLVGPAPSPAMANETVDMVTTGSVATGVATPAIDDKGSAGFRAALKTLVDGDPVAAFAEAGQLANEVERKAIQWAAIQFNSGKIDFEAIRTFATEAPDFAPASFYRTRIEQSLTRDEASEATIADVLGDATPGTIDAQILLAGALLAQGETERATTLTRSIWTENFLTEVQEARVEAKLGSLLDRDAHWARAMHLMMHDRARGSERLLPHLSEAQTSLIVARAAVSRNDADAKALLDKVDPSLRGNAVYIFSRAQRARQFELWDSAVSWLDKAPAELIDADEWWYERRILVRKLLDVGYPELAYRAAAGYTDGPEARMVDALFHAGWIALAFLDDAAAAKGHFTELTKHTTLPDSISQANYWLARAEVKLGDIDAARAALTVAAQYNTVYYGQLARTELGEAGVGIRPLPAVGPDAAVFNANPVVRAVRLLAGNGQARLAVPLLRNFGTTLSEGGELLLAAQLAEEIGAHQVAIAIATSADQRGTPLDIFSFPQDARLAEADLAAERAAVYAVVRQESMFQLDAVSSAGARGLMQLMQLMPGTAQEVARKVGVDYSPARLVSDAEYNALLGSTYLSTQLDRYGGSLVLAAAAYNAGPGNASKWITAYGDPRADNVDPVIWVELIPFSETRTYVKRVLGNYLVYRERLGDSPVPLQQALRTIR
ncbi:MAG: lytic transglycosylase domain-containing protein [Candidatus Devosia phytovorans]|uniref:Lytic transglycosylase domain-containing protein n=1 Tax=Candidatus Devosia phytovorans TaxID=3121372 RepID=A0AAJ6B187_9HYPH|nr:lytic transglycosylase domain-containing protein [Devosia sp.]WEK06515.1 MAG: lytic transglycosylase domain-containing protein [Devosia sp.]